VCIAFSSPDPNIIQPEWVKTMASDSIVFACANPVPEIWPWDAKEAGARITGGGRSDFPNQVNNSLGFPGIFRGVLDVQASRITDEMATAAALELAAYAEEQGLNDEHILPAMDDWEVVPREAVATAMKAQEQGLAKLSKSREELFREASTTIQEARQVTHTLMKEGLIRPVPELD
jgi:malate dehydrogenase (oxaloacetate-decarboxylating)